ncbi:hypothetical protein AGMMS49543_20760 [Betaproteobacteria bacterium]|nr:hypothetical protein AGMMS49543_20760 [Betaproteobacteria bacterium]
MEMIVRQEHHHIDTVKTEKEAYVQLQSKTYDYLFLNTAGNPDYLSSIRSFKILNTYMDVVAVLPQPKESDNAADVVKEEVDAIEAGAIKVLRKPYNVERVIETLNGAVLVAELLVKIKVSLLELLSSLFFGGKK